MQTVLVANGRSFPPSFCCVSLSHGFFPFAPLVTPGKHGETRLSSRRDVGTRLLREKSAISALWLRFRALPFPLPF